MKEVIHNESAMIYPAVSRVRRASWGAIFAGAFVTLIVELMFMFLGAAIGASIFHRAGGTNPTHGRALASGIWVLVTSLISTWFGAFIAGRLSGGPRRTDGLLHGIVTWSVATCASIFLLTSAAGHILNGAAQLLNLMSNVSQTQQGQEMLGSAKQELQQAQPRVAAALSPTGRETSPSSQSGQSLEALASQDPDLGAAVANLQKAGASPSQADRSNVINLLTSKHGMNQQQASAMVDNWERQSEQAATPAEQPAPSGTTAAKGVSETAWAGFITLILGLLVSAWGGWSGTASLSGYAETALPATTPVPP